MGQLAGLALAWKQVKDVDIYGTHIEKYFDEKLHDFSLLKPDMIKLMVEITNHFRKCNEQKRHDVMIDPTLQFLHACSPIGSPRGIKNEMNPAMKKQHEDYKENQRRRLPSPSSHVDETQPFDQEKLVQITHDEREKLMQQSLKLDNQIEALKKARCVKVAPAVALYNQRVRRVSTISSKAAVCVTYLCFAELRRRV